MSSLYSLEEILERQYVRSRVFATFSAILRKISWAVCCAGLEQWKVELSLMSSKLFGSTWKAKLNFAGLCTPEATPGQTLHSGSSRDLYRGHWLNATVRDLRHWNFHLPLFWLALRLLCDVLYVTMNAKFSWELLHCVHRLIHISPSYWTFYRSFEIILEWELSIGLQFKFNVLCKSIASKKHSIWYELYFKIYLIAEGSSGSNG